MIQTSDRQPRKQIVVSDLAFSLSFKKTVISMDKRKRDLQPAPNSIKFRQNLRFVHETPAFLKQLMNKHDLLVDRSEHSSSNPSRLTFEQIHEERLAEKFPKEADLVNQIDSDLEETGDDAPLVIESTEDSSRELKAVIKDLRHEKEASKGHSGVSNKTLSKGLVFKKINIPDTEASNDKIQKVSQVPKRPKKPKLSFDTTD